MLPAHMVELFPAKAVAAGKMVSTRPSVTSPVQGAIETPCKVSVTLPAMISSGLG